MPSKESVQRTPYHLTGHQVLIPEPPLPPAWRSQFSARYPSGFQEAGASEVREQRWIQGYWVGKNTTGVSYRTSVPVFQYAQNVPGYHSTPVTTTLLYMYLSWAFRWCHYTKITSLHQNPCPTWVLFSSCQFVSIYSFVCLLNTVTPGL